ncbi:MAG TPA: Rieske 2Fe-2S domain-containing protein [Ferruginibacter sp.]|nr:Rieske 2Fe-2S domain-containing protein [Ferruginibacter sp.]HMP20030.1 Rieske 2Fe-2S domain-containing protein [Ferruginibacter sp.]
MPAEKKYHWHKIAESKAMLQLGTGGTAEIQVDGKNICLIVHNDWIYGCAAKCPHAGGRLADGYTDALGNIVCPLHRYKFSLHNGRNSSGEGYFLKTYPVQEREDGIYLGIEEKTGFFGG